MERQSIAEFTVYGVAKTAGSKKGFYNPKAKRVIITDDTGEAGKSWRAAVQDAARPHFTVDGVLFPVEGALEIEIVFYRARPKGHYGSGRNARFVKDNVSAHPITKPDVDKMSRAILDALSKVAYGDDAQIVSKTVSKRYAETDRTEVKIFYAAEQYARQLPERERVRELPRDHTGVEQPSLIAA
jgi:Holliday junction resolvase RusA-like endonuclease